MLAFVIVAAMYVKPSSGQTRQDEPTASEIERAYLSKSGEGGTFIPLGRWERWRIKEIRGWSLHFRRTGEKRLVGMLTRQYQGVAKKNGSCAEYQITDTMPLTVNVRIKPSVSVDSGGVKACR
jgi:hypothetical protein